MYISLNFHLHLACLRTLSVSLFYYAKVNSDLARAYIGWKIKKDRAVTDISVVLKGPEDPLGILRTL